ncbi:MAG TPA: ribosome-associated translation inhibitor RaiA [Myxococcales bacterium]
MQVNITFRNMFATDALRNHVTDKLSKVVDKYLDKVTEAHVTLSLERYLHHADINLHAGTFHVRGKEKSEDMYASIDLACDKIERQLKKYKDRLKNHRPAHVHAREPVRVRYEIFAASPTEGLPPEVVRSNEFLAKPMSVEEALMQMDLMNNDFLVFTRPDSRDVNVVYRRKDGNFGLIQADGEMTTVAVPPAAGATPAVGQPPISAGLAK